MIKKVCKTAVALLLSLSFSGCDVARQLGGAVNMVQCQYDFQSVSNLSLGGVNLSQGVSLAALPAVASLLTGQAATLPLNFDLNLNVTNPNATEALLNGLQYVLTIDEVQFTTGSIDRALNIPAGQNAVMPMSMGVDLKTLMTGESKDAIVAIVKNFVGMGNTKSNVSLQIKPTFLIGGYPVTSPVYIPVNFSFGGAK